MDSLHLNAKKTYVSSIASLTDLFNR